MISSGMIEQFAASKQNQFLSDPTGYISSSIEATLQRMCDPCAAAMVVKVAHDGGSLHGRGFDFIPMAFIPRVFWRDKPTIDRGRYFTAVLGWASDAAVARSSTGTTSAGELYWNFGWPGVVIGMYMFGAVLSGLWWRAAGTDPRRGILEMSAYIGVLLSFVLGTGGTAGGGFVGAVSAGLFWRGLIVTRDWIFRSRSARANWGAYPAITTYKIESRTA
jgi:hypothetical protein